MTADKNYESRSEGGNRPGDSVQLDDQTKKAAAATLVAGVAVAVLQPALLPGLAIGAAAVLSPKLFSLAGQATRFLAKTIIRTGFQVVHATQGMVAEVGEEFRDIVAEARPKPGAPTNEHE